MIGCVTLLPLFLVLILGIQIMLLRFPTYKAQEPGDVGYTRFITSVLAPIVAGILGMIVAAYIFVRDGRRKKIHVRLEFFFKYSLP